MNIIKPPPAIPKLQPLILPEITQLNSVVNLPIKKKPLLTKINTKMIVKIHL